MRDVVASDWICLAPSPSVDVTYLVPQFSIGQIHRPADAVRVPGGKSLNAARVGHTLGVRPVILAALGGESGTWIVEQLGHLGITVLPVRTAQPTRTCISIASECSLTEIYELAVALSDIEWHAFAEAARSTVKARISATEGSAAPWVTMSGSIPGDRAAQAAELLLELSEFGARVAIDSSGQALSAVVKRNPALVKINRSEAIELLQAEQRAPLNSLARQLAELTGGLVVITDGRAGAVGVDSSGTSLRVWSTASPGRFAVGSGDAVLGGLMAGLTGQLSFPAALAQAVVAGTANAFCPGAGVLATADWASIQATIETEYI